MTVRGHDADNARREIVQGREAVVTPRSAQRGTGEVFNRSAMMEAHRMNRTETTKRKMTRCTSRSR